MDVLFATVSSHFLIYFLSQQSNYHQCNGLEGVPQSECFRKDKFRCFCERAKERLMLLLANPERDHCFVRKSLL